MRPTFVTKTPRLLALCGGIVACSAGATATIYQTDAGSSSSSGSSSSGSSTSSSGGSVPQNHRAAAVACPLDRGPGMPPDASAGATCTRDADCTMGLRGRCMQVTRCGGACQTRVECTYDDCAADADCAALRVCSCRPSPSSNARNACLPAGTCRVDADCAGGHGYCSPNPVGCTSFADSSDGYYCHTAQDDCTNDSDCGAGENCWYDASPKKWHCKNLNAACPVH